MAPSEAFMPAVAAIAFEFEEEDDDADADADADDDDDEEEEMAGERDTDPVASSTRHSDPILCLTDSMNSCASSHATWKSCQF
jgi:hypothetical protein